MKPDSPTNGHSNADEPNTNAMKILSSVINVSTDNDGDYDDDEVMNFMHSHIHKQLIKFTGKGSDKNQEGMMDGDTKAYFDEVIRGSALFGLLPDDDGEPDEANKENFDSFFGTDMEDNENQSEEPKDNTARLQLSRLLLTKKVAEAFKINLSDKNNDDDDAMDSKNSLSWGSRMMKVTDENQSGYASRHSEYSIETDLGAERLNLLDESNAPGLAQRLETDLAGSLVSMWQQRLTQSTTSEADLDILYASSVNSTGPPSPRGDDVASGHADGSVDGNGNASKAPFAVSKDGNTNLEEIRARLRKTQFDYSSDSGQKVAEEAPAPVDYRNVLKKKHMK
ncbi:hypothetical protein BsWGS_18484 [Bradybaena similaris]